MNHRHPRAFAREVAAFSLLEVMVAMAVLAVMMAFMFTLVANSFRAWESGVRQIEAVQAARIGLDRIADELLFSMSQAADVLRDNGPTITNIVPFRAIVPVGSSAAPVPGDNASTVSMPPMSAQLYAVSPVMDPLAAHGPFTEVGYYCSYNRDTNPYAGMSPRSYFLMWHRPTGQQEPKHDFYFRGSVSTNWFAGSENTAGTSGNRWPLVDNCYNMRLRFASNSAAGLQFVPDWPSTNSLPAGVLVTLSVFDSKTAARLRQLRPGGLTAADLAPNATGDVPRILREGTVQVSRFVPFLNSTN